MVIDLRRRPAICALARRCVRQSAAFHRGTYRVAAPLHRPQMDLLTVVAAEAEMRVMHSVPAVCASTIGRRNYAARAHLGTYRRRNAFTSGARYLGGVASNASRRCLLFLRSPGFLLAPGRPPERGCVELIAKAPRNRLDVAHTRAGLFRVNVPLLQGQNRVPGHPCLSSYVAQVGVRVVQPLADE